MLKNSKVAFGISEIIRNGGDSRLLADPEAFIKAHPEASRIGSAAEIEAAIADYPDMLGKASEQSLDRQTQVEAARQKANSNDGREERIKENQFRGAAAALGDDVTNNLKKYVQGKQALDTASDGIAKIEADYAKTKKLNPNMANAVARSIAKAFNSGAMTDRDVNDFQSRPGFEGWAEKSLIKWLTGSVDIKLMRNLKDVVDTSRKTMITGARTVYDGLEVRTKAYPDRRDEMADIAGLKTYKRDLFDGGGGGKTITVDGVTYPIDKAEQIANANKTHPKSAKILDAIKKARGQ
jgi:hypothetical protein